MVNPEYDSDNRSDASSEHHEMAIRHGACRRITAGVHDAGETRDYR